VKLIESDVRRADVKVAQHGHLQFAPPAWEFHTFAVDHEQGGLDLKSPEQQGRRRQND
jgi:hypothetical protein